MSKRKCLIVFLVLLFGLGISAYQYYSALKAELVSATSTVPNPGHLWSTMECNSDSLCIDNTNNRLGIGTTAPGVKFHISGDGNLVKIENTNGTTANKYAQMELKAGTADNYIWTNNQNSTGFYGGSSALNIYTGQSSPIVFFTNGNNERMRISGDGNVGIGITAPTQKLDVVGSIKASGDICSSGICLNQVAQYYNTNPLYNSTHTIANCMTAGGTVIANPDGSGLPICKVSNAAGASCPSGWTQYKGYSTLTPATGCGGAWANITPTTQTSLYCINADRNDGICYCRGSTNILYTAASDGGFCICSSTATTRTEIGCY